MIHVLQNVSLLKFVLFETQVYLRFP